MDFKQEKLSGFTTKRYDGQGNLTKWTVVNFSTTTWTEQQLDKDGNMLDQYQIGRDGKRWTS